MTGPATEPSGSPDATPRSRGEAFVALSEIEVPEAGATSLEQAFQTRLGRVDAWPGFLDLEVWRDEHTPGRYLMVSWWQTDEAFRAYMRSEDHQASHDRIPSGEHRPRPVGLTRYRVVAR